MLYLADLYNCKILRRAVVDLVSLWVTLEPCFPFSSYMYLRNFLLDWQLHLNAFLFSSLLLLSFVLEYIINIRLLFIASFSYLLLLCFLIAWNFSQLSTFFIFLFPALINSFFAIVFTTSQSNWVVTAAHQPLCVFVTRLAIIERNESTSCNGSNGESDVWWRIAATQATASSENAHLTTFGWRIRLKELSRYLKPSENSWANFLCCL